MAPSAGNPDWTGLEVHFIDAVAGKMGFEVDYIMAGTPMLVSFFYVVCGQPEDHKCLVVRGYCTGIEW